MGLAMSQSAIRLVRRDHHHGNTPAVVALIVVAALAANPWRMFTVAGRRSWDDDGRLFALDRGEPACPSANLRYFQR